MKKNVCLLLLTLLVTTLFAQEFTLSGEVKTGLLWNKTDREFKEAGYINREENTFIQSKDYAGNYQGRFRLNMKYSIKNLGIKLRFNWDDWSGDALPALPYAFGYGNFFDDQLTISIGKLGASSWGTGGPEMLQEVENYSKGGLRVEYKPSFVPGLNVGVIINGFDGPISSTWQDALGNTKPVTFFHALQETALGAAYTHEYFHVNAAYRFDSEVDNRFNGNLPGKDGGDLVYRAEERVLRNILPGSQVWAQGSFTGLGADTDNKENFNYKNWLYLQYEPDLFTAQIRIGYDSTYAYASKAGEPDKIRSDKGILHIRPSFYLNLFDKKLVVGGSFWYGKDFGEGNISQGSPFLFMEIEPKIQYNISPNVYFALVYNYRKGYIDDFVHSYTDKPIAQNHWVNLRFGVFF